MRKIDNKVLVPIVALQLLGCLAVFQVGDTTLQDTSDRIVVEYKNSVWLLTARVSCVGTFIALGALVFIAAGRKESEEKLR